MKILHVITSLLPGGAEKLVADLLPRLQAKGHEVELLLLDGTQAPFLDLVRAGGIPVHISAVGVNVYHPRHIFPRSRPPGIHSPPDHGRGARCRRQRRRERRFPDFH